MAKVFPVAHNLCVYDMHDIFHSNICMCVCVTDDDEDVVESNENRIERLEREALVVR